jgi:hypothetical protein
VSLGRTYRFVVLNNTGQNLVAGTIVIRGRRWNFNTSGMQAWEAAEAVIDSNAATLATGSYWVGTVAAGIDNSVNAHLGGTFRFSVTAPGASNGAVTIYLQRSTDGGTTWPDNGLGTPIKVFNFTTSGTQTDVIEI